MHLNVLFVFLFTDDIVSHLFFIVFENVIFCVVRLIQRQPRVLFLFCFLFETVEAKWKNSLQQNEIASHKTAQNWNEAHGDPDLYL